MRVYWVILAATLAGCQSRTDPTASSQVNQDQPPDVVAVRGAQAPVEAPVQNAFTQNIQAQVTALNRAKETAAMANQKVAQDDKQAANAGR